MANIKGSKGTGNPRPNSRKGIKNKKTLVMEEIGQTSLELVAKTLGTLQRSKLYNLETWAKKNQDLWWTRVFPRLLPTIKPPEDAGARQIAIFINSPPPDTWTRPHNLAPEEWQPPVVPEYAQKSLPLPAPVDCDNLSTQETDEEVPDNV
jgi:hypothetical protein